MKTSPLILAFFAASAMQAQQPQPPAQPKPDNKDCVWVQPPPLKLPPKWHQELDRRRAEFERKTGIALPPPPPPKPKLVCPPSPSPAPVPPGQPTTQAQPTTPPPANPKQ